MALSDILAQLPGLAAAASGEGLALDQRKGGAVPAAPAVNVGAMLQGAQQAPTAPSAPSPLGTPAPASDALRSQFGALYGAAPPTALPPQEAAAPRLEDERISKQMVDVNARRIPQFLASMSAQQRARLLSDANSERNNQQQENYARQAYNEGIAAQNEAIRQRNVAAQQAYQQQQQAAQQRQQQAAQQRQQQQQSNQALQNFAKGNAAQTMQQNQTRGLNQASGALSGRATGSAFSALQNRNQPQAQRTDDVRKRGTNTRETKTF